MVEANKQKSKIPNRISLLVMPDEKHELYYWYAGNPFGFHDDRSAIVAFDNTFCNTEPLDPQSLEVAKLIYRVSDSIGYLIAKKEFMVIEVPSPRWDGLSQEILQFFPSNRSIVKDVRDKRQIIAKTENVQNRINRVVAAEKKFAVCLPEVVFEIPEQRIFTPEEITQAA